MSAVDAGAAAHLVLQHLDFRRPCDEADLTAQVAELVERKLVAASQADVVDVGALVWLVQSPIGELLRTHAGDLRRELPVFIASDAPAGSSDPQDRVMLRGRIDVLIPDPAGGAVVIDYKTDRVTAEQASRRAETYALQTDAYRKAVAAITGRPPREVLLVLLHPRVIHRV